MKEVLFNLHYYSFILPPSSLLFRPLCLYGKLLGPIHSSEIYLP